jgi:uncharacterized membrane protein
MQAFAISLHILSTVIWVGGMFFAHQVLRPVAAGQLEPPPRLTLWTGVFGRFFPWVWAAVLALPASGYWLALKLYGGFAAFPLHVQVMQGLGWLMILLYLHMYFAPYQRIKAAVAAHEWPAAADQLARIRRIVGINLILGLCTSAIAAAGRFGLFV